MGAYDENKDMKVNEIVSMFSQLKEVGFVPTAGRSDWRETSSMPFCFDVYIDPLNRFLHHLINEQIILKSWSFRIHDPNDLKPGYVLCFSNEADAIMAKLIVG